MEISVAEKNCLHYRIKSIRHKTRKKGRYPLNCMYTEKEIRSLADCLVVFILIKVRVVFFFFNLFLLKHT